MWLLQGQIPYTRRVWIPAFAGMTAGGRIPLQEITMKKF